MGSATTTATTNTAEQSLDNCLWRPQVGPQTSLLTCPVEDVFFGGARGGGKTDGLLGDWISHQHYYAAAARGVILRKTYPELEEIETRAAELYKPLGARYHSTKRTWYFANGANLKLRYLDQDADADSYQGHSYTFIGWDEAPNWPSSAPLDKLRACLRSAKGVPCVLRSTGNPGGPGHNWVKARYIDPSPPYKPFFDREMGCWRVFIPSRLDDNTILTTSDPGYWARVVAAAGGREDILKAWRYGLWDIVAGGMFDDVWKRGVHDIAPIQIPQGWRVTRSFDWGSSKPFSVGWWAECDGTSPAGVRCYPRGTLIRVAELYGCTTKPNEGLKLTATEIAGQVKDIESRFTFKVNPGPADSSIFDAENGVCIADDMAAAGISWERADKGPGSRVNGWDRMRKMMKASMASPMEEPGLFIFENCRQFIRTVPVLPRGRIKSDDVDTTAEDHIGDETRYRVMWASTVPKGGLARVSGW